MKTLVCLLSLLIFAGYDVLGAEAKGLLIYTDHPSTYVECCEFYSLDSTKPSYYTIVRADGRRLQINPGGLWIVVDYPQLTAGEDIMAVADSDMATIQSLETQYPQFNGLLKAAHTKWKNALAFARQLPKTNQTVAGQSQASATTPAADKLSFVSSDGIKYENVTITGHDDAGVTVMTDVGVEHIDFERLPKEVQQRFQYDPAKAAAFRQKAAVIQQSVQKSVEEKIKNDKQNLSSSEPWFDEEEQLPPASLSSDKNPDPTYQDTLQFINEKLKTYHCKMWFGKNTGLMICDKSLSEGNVYVFDPGNLDPEIKMESRDNTYYSITRTAYWITISIRTGAPDILMINRKSGKQMNVKNFTLTTEDDVGSEKLGKALQHLIHMFGGKKDLF